MMLINMPDMITMSASRRLMDSLMSVTSLGYVLPLQLHNSRKYLTSSSTSASVSVFPQGGINFDLLVDSPVFTFSSLQSLSPAFVSRLILLFDASDSA